MRIRRIPVLVLTVGLLIAVAPLFAHHANAVFDTEKKVTVKGTVVEWLWANPHCLLRFDVTDDKGEVAHWVGETQAPINMIGNRSEEHTSELQSRLHLVCRLLLEKKKNSSPRIIRRGTNVRATIESAA